MPTKNNNNELIEQLQKIIDLKFTILVDQNHQLNKSLDNIDDQIQKHDQRVIKLNDKIDSLDDCVKVSFDQFNKKLTEHALKIAVLENFKTVHEHEQTTKEKLVGYSKWLIFAIIGAFVAGAALEPTLVSPIINYLRG